MVTVHFHLHTVKAAMQGYYFLKIRVIAPTFAWAHGEGKLLQLIFYPATFTFSAASMC